MAFWRTVVLRHLFTLIPCLTMGCSDEDLPPYAPVEGKITLADGTPVADAMVIFTPDGEQGTKGPIAVGTVDSSGSYQLKTASRVDGAVVGHHKVTVELNSDPYSSKKNVLSLPRQYGNVQSTPLKAEVKADERNKLDFELMP